MLSYIICEDFPKPYLVSSVAKFCPTLVTPWTVAHQAPLFMGFSRWEYWSGLPFLSSEDLPNPGIEPTSPALQADSLSLSHWGKPMFSHSGGIVLYFCKSTSALIVSWILICFRCVPWCYITHHVSSGKLHHTLTGEWKWKRQLKVLFVYCQAADHVLVPPLVTVMGSWEVRPGRNYAKSQMNGQNSCDPIPGQLSYQTCGHGSHSSCIKETQLSPVSAWWKNASAI